MFLNVNHIWAEFIWSDFSIKGQCHEYCYITPTIVYFQKRQWQATPVLLPRKSHGWRSLVGCIPWGHYESVVTEQLHFHFHAMEKEMATHCSVLAWRIPGTAEPGGLPSMGSHIVGHDWSDLAAAAAASITLRFGHKQWMDSDVISWSGEVWGGID